MRQVTCGLTSWRDAVNATSVRPINAVLLLLECCACWYKFTLTVDKFRPRQVTNCLRTAAEKFKASKRCLDCKALVPKCHLCGCAKKTNKTGMNKALEAAKHCG